jgi:hypothetical protein
MSLRRVSRVVLSACLFAAAVPSMNLVAAQAASKKKATKQSKNDATVAELCATDTPNLSAASSTVVVTQKNPAPATTTNIKRVVFCSLNTYRYFFEVQVQEFTKNGPAPASGFNFPMNSGSGGSGSGAAGAALVALTTPTNTTPSTPDTEDILADLVVKYQKAAQASANSFQTSQNVATKKLACLVGIAQQFPVQLTDNQKDQLLAMLNGAGSCASGDDPAWNDDSLQNVFQQVGQVIDLNSRLAQFQTTAAYNQWVAGTDASGKPLPARSAVSTDARKAIYAQLYTWNSATLTQLQGIVTSTSVATYNTTLISLQNWEKRRNDIINGTAKRNEAASLACRDQWFGKVDGDIVTLQSVDWTATPTPSAFTTSAQITNTCISPLTVTDGTGISFVRSSTFAFEPKTDYTQNSPVTTQVIGYSANWKVTPLFVGQMNYAYVDKSVGMHISGGAGVSASSSGPSADFFIGNALSFFHRAVFVTPMFHITQRQELMSGYSVGNPQGSLTSVPVINGWKTGFALTITLPVIPQ